MANTDVLSLYSHNELSTSVVGAGRLTLGIIAGGAGVVDRGIRPVM